MPRVVVKNQAKNVTTEAAFSCPVNAFRKLTNGEIIIDPTVCIDCGVCETEAPKGVIVSESEASDEDKKFNNEKSKEGQPVQ